jgi:hypothetical protein
MNATYMYAGQASPVAKHYLGIQPWTPEESAPSRLKPVQTRAAD